MTPWWLLASLVPALVAAVLYWRIRERLAKTDAARQAAQIQAARAIRELAVAREQFASDSAAYRAAIAASHAAGAKARAEAARVALDAADPAVGGAHLGRVLADAVAAKSGGTKAADGVPGEVAAGDAKRSRRGRK